MQCWWGGNHYTNLVNNFTSPLVVTCISIILFAIALAMFGNLEWTIIG